MRGLLVPGLILAVGILCTAALIVWLRRRGSGGSFGRSVNLANIRSTHGAARCLAVTHLLSDLGRRGDSTRIANAWNDLEMPLLEALPDCPPDAKTALIDALDACAKACRVVACRHSIMTIRNSLL
jgi:hypothetical protein